jgi:hypothetical protein
MSKVTHYLTGPIGEATMAGDADFVDLILNNQGRHRNAEIPSDPALAVAYADGLIAAANRFKHRQQVEARTGMGYMEALLAGKAG